MNAALHRDITPVIDPQRALFLRAFVALINETLSEAMEPIPGCTARQVTGVLEQSGLAVVTGSGTDLQMTMLGVTARSNGTHITLLRTWQREAKRRIEEGLR